MLGLNKPIYEKPQLMAILEGYQKMMDHFLGKTDKSEVFSK